MTAAPPRGRCDLTVFVPEPASVRGAPGVLIRPLPPAHAVTPSGLARSATTPYVALAGPGDRPDLTRLTALTAALDADPLLVLAFGRAAPAATAPDPARHPWAFPLTEGPGRIEGPALALAVLVNGANVIGPSGAVVLRRGALGDGGPDADLGLWLTLLLQGPAWYDPALTATTAADPDDVPGWPALVEAAVDARLLAPREAEPAVLARLARLAVTARQRCEEGGAPAPVASDVRALADALDAARHAERPIDVLVLADGAPDVARRSAGAARPFAMRVIVADRSGAPLPHDDASVAWVPADWAGDDSARLLAAGARPVLVVAAGEVPEVLDPAQLALVAEGAAPGFAAEVAAPGGAEVRLVTPGPGADTKVGSATPARVHAVRLRSPDEQDWLAVGACPVPDEPRRFAVAAPGFRADSGGVVALHRLCDLLNRIGHHAELLPIDGRAETCPGWHTPVTRSAADAVVVYPEIVPGNPLAATHVVRWLLNRPGEISRVPLDVGPSDLIVAWNQAIDPALPVLTVPLFDPRVFFPKDVPGRGALLWVGKGRLPDGFARAGTTLVTRAWPATRPELAALLRSADVLYSCDWMTALAYESLLCGTPVVLVGDQQWRRDELIANGIVLPGMAFEDGALDEARVSVAQTAAVYREQVDGIAAHVAAFVALVERHFGWGTRRERPMAATAASR